MDSRSIQHTVLAISLQSYGGDTPDKEFRGNEELELDTEAAFPFHELMRRVRLGDQCAAAELVQQYEPYIRRSARNRLRSSQLRRVLDSLDICQSVLASLFHRTAKGEYQLETPDQLQKLLVRMVQNKVIDAWRRYSVRILGIDGVNLSTLAQEQLPPDEDACQSELVSQVRDRLTPAERKILEQRESGVEWSLIADKQGVSPERLRKQLSRAIDRAARELGVVD